MIVFNSAFLSILVGFSVQFGAGRGRPAFETVADRSRVETAAPGGDAPATARTAQTKVGTSTSNSLTHPTTTITTTTKN